MQPERVPIKPEIHHAIALESGIELELHTPTPRHVVYTKGTHLGRIWYACFFVGILFLAYFCWTSYKGLPQERIYPVVMALLYLALLIMLWWFFMLEKTVRHSRYLLQNGCATRATVLECEETDSESVLIEIVYSYTAVNGERSISSLRLGWNDAHSAGGLDVGTTFTILLHPTIQNYIFPYFQITGSEILGASLVQTTPPKSRQSRFQ